jgi:uncharacterized phiE125 gp8 family phage protein
MGVFVVTPPAVKIVTLEKVKAHCRIDGDDENATLEDAIAAVTNTLDGPDGDSGFAFLPQRLEQRMTRFGKSVLGGRCSARIELDYPPLRDESTIQVQYFDADNALITLDPAQYFVAQPSKLSAYLMPVTGWPWTFDRPDSVRIRFDAGFASLPPRIHNAALLMVADLFEHREATPPDPGLKAPLTPAAERLLAGYWRPRIP